MIPHFASMDRINYRRLSAVYVTDMKHPENSDRTTWDYLTKGNFYFQNNDNPYTIIGRDHCRKQENKKNTRRGDWKDEEESQDEEESPVIQAIQTAPIVTSWLLLFYCK